MQSVNPEQNPEDREVQVDKVVLDVTLVCEPVDPEIVFDPLLMNRSTAKIFGMKFADTRLQLGTHFRSTTFASVPD